MLLLEDCFDSDMVVRGKLGWESATFPKGNQQRKHDSQSGDSMHKRHDSTPAAAHPIHNKLTMFSLKATTCFFVFLCLFNPFSTQSIAQRGILCV